MYPWFKAPAAGAPQKYDGWAWDPGLWEWVTAQVSEIIVDIEVPRFPKPAEVPRAAQTLYVPGWHWFGRAGIWEDIPLTPQELSEGIERGPKPKYPPGPAGPTTVEGWSWSATSEAWVATIVVSEPVGFEPPRSLPPYIDHAQVNLVFPMAEQYALFQANLRSMGLTQTEAKRIGSSMVDGFWNMSRSAATKIRAANYQQSMLPAARALDDSLEKIGVYGAIIALTAIVGLLIGNILDRVVTPGEDFFILPGGMETYLLDPENVRYSREVGKSATGRRYFSACDGIGTEYTRLKRGYGIGQRDILDFPGGFVETGYQFPYWVKYTWSYWELVYVGMLSSAGARLHVLKVDKYFTGAVVGTAEILPPAEWCPNFRWYL